MKHCDFGLTCRFTAGQILNMFCGTVAYWAPQSYQGRVYDGPTGDIWNLGVLLYLMLMG